MQVIIASAELVCGGVVRCVLPRRHCSGPAHCLAPSSAVWGSWPPRPRDAAGGTQTGITPASRPTATVCLCNHCPSGAGDWKLLVKVTCGEVSTCGEAGDIWWSGGWCMRVQRRPSAAPQFQLARSWAQQIENSDKLSWPRAARCVPALRASCAPSTVVHHTASLVALPQLRSILNGISSFYGPYIDLYHRHVSSLIICRDCMALAHFRHVNLADIAHRCYTSAFLTFHHPTARFAPDLGPPVYVPQPGPLPRAAVGV